jgi:hypothetical protein
MSDGILVVESQPASAEDTPAFHKWYNEIHLPEMLALDGFTSARRFAADDGETFVTVYEISGDIEAAKASLAAAQQSRTMSMPEGFTLAGRPTVRYFLML